MAILIPDKFVFVHWPRAGGTWLTRQIMAACPDAVDIAPTHQKIVDLPKECRGLPIVSIICDPVDWLESHFSYHQHIRGWNTGSKLDKYSKHSVDSYCFDVMENHVGLLDQYTDAYTDGADYVIRHESLVEQTRHLFERYGLTISGTHKINSSRHEDRLSPRMADRWRCSNATYCERFGYPLPAGPVYSHGDWSGHWRTTCQYVLAPRLSGRPVNLLEIGVCEGRGAQAAFELLLRHPESRYTGIDIWQLNPRHRAERNVGLFSNGRHSLIDAERRLSANERGPFDVIYIDGDHTYNGCQSDLKRWAPHVKQGGFLVIDDYGSESIASDHLGVKESTDAWLAQVAYDWSVVDRSYQLVLQRAGGNG